MAKKLKCCVIIVAAGIGSRMGKKIPKQFLKLIDKPILSYTLEKFDKNENVDEIILVINNEYLDYVRKEIVEKYNYNKKIKIISGGNERQKSVYEGLKAINSTDIVLIHDGVRPFINNDDINKLIVGVKKFEACVLGVRVKDTIKISEDSNIVSKTIDRSKTWAIQTPQGFTYKKIVKAYTEANRDKYTATDDASLVEYTGEKVYILESSYSNIKITTKEDLYYAEFLIEKDLKN